MKEAKKCNLKGCNRNVKFPFINTILGEFCSVECREKVENRLYNIFKDLKFEVNVKPTGIKICPCCKIPDCKDEECEF